MANNTYQTVDWSALMPFMGAKSTAFASSHNLTISSELSEITCKDIFGKWASSKVKKMSWTATSDNLYSEKSAKALIEAQLAGTQVELVFAQSASSATGWESDRNSVV